MSIVSGTVGAVMGANATGEAAETAAQASRYAADQSAAVQREMYNNSTAEFAPYRALGQYGAGQIAGFDLMKGVGEQPSYDAEYTDKLKDYESSPAYTAQNALGQQNLQRQLNARGLNYGATGASAGAELSQKLQASDFDKYRGDLASRYSSLQGEFAQRRDINQKEYSQLSDLVNWGQASSARQAALNTNTANGLSQAYNQSGVAQSAAATQAGAATAGLYSGLGGASAGAASAGVKGYQVGKDLGWWGNSAGSNAVSTGAPASVGIGDEGAMSWIA